MADWAPEHFVPVAGFLILALALLLFYFSAMRPRRGTTEWMGRIDRPRFAALRCGRLRALDAPWGVLAAVCGAAAAVLAASAFAPQTADFLRLQTAFAAAEAAAEHRAQRRARNKVKKREPLFPAVPFFSWVFRAERV